MKLPFVTLYREIPLDLEVFTKPFLVGIIALIFVCLLDILLPSTLR